MNKGGAYFEAYDIARRKGLSHDEAVDTIELVTDPIRWAAFVTALNNFADSARTSSGGAA